MEKRHYISQDDLEKLLKWKSEKGILSVYLTIKPEGRATQQWKALCKSELGKITNAEGSDDKLKKVVEAVQSEIIEFSAKYPRRSIVLFRNVETGETFIKSIQLPFKNQVVLMETAFLRPVVAMMDEAPALGIIILSKEYGRVLTWRQGLIDEDEEKRFEFNTGLDEEVSPPGSGVGHLSGSQSDNYAQKVEVQIKKELSGLAKEIGHIAQELDWQSLIIFGSHRFTDTFEDNLPVQWQDKVIGILDKNLINSTITHIADLTTELLSTWKRKIEHTLVGSILETAGAGGKAVLGFQNTIDALEQYRCSHFIFSSDLKVEGWVDETGALMVELDAEMAEGLGAEPHVIERMIELAFDAGTRITPLDEEAARILKEHGGAAALLRY